MTIPFAGILSKSLLAAAVLPLAFGSLAHAEEHLVHFGGQGDFLTIQGAITAAVDGDLVVVLPGQYSESIVIDGKSVRVVGFQTGNAVQIVGGISIVNLSPNQPVSLHGLTIEGTNSGPATVEIRDSEGHVRIQNCTMQTADLPSWAFVSPVPALALDTCTRVTIVDSECVAGSIEFGFGSNSASGGIGLHTIGSKVAIWNSVFQGGLGASSLYDPGGLGGRGVSAIASNLLLVQCDVGGGGGGSNGDIVPIPGGAGGSGLHRSGSTSIFDQGSTFTGGAGGQSNLGLDGPDGVAMSGAGPFTSLGGIERNWNTSALIPSGFSHALSASGLPGESAEFWVYRRQSHFFDTWPIAPTTGPVNDFAMQAYPSLRVPIGMLNVAGDLSSNATLPALPASETSVPLVGIVRSGLGLQSLALAKPVELIALNCQTLQPDCDSSGQSDLCEIILGAVADTDGNGIPDVCQTDCNNNGVGDGQDIQNGTSLDLNQDGVPDECQPSQVDWFVDPNVPAGGSGSSLDPFSNIRSAVNIFLPGDEIVLRDGTYTGIENTELDLGDRPFVIRSESGPANCLIDLQNTNSYFFSAFDTNTTIRIRIEGVRVENAPTFMIGEHRGVISTAGLGLDVVNCQFRNNRKTCLYIRSAHLLAAQDDLIVDSVFEFNSGGTTINTPSDSEPYQVLRCHFEGNSTPGSAAAMRNPTVVFDCTFIGNVSGDDAGAIASPGLVMHSRFLGNQAGDEGGAIKAYTAQIYQCVFAGNQARRGGALFVSGVQTGVDVRQCTITDNFATLEGGGIAMDYQGEVTIRNSILTFNSAPIGQEVYVRGPAASADLFFSTINGGLSSVHLENNGTLGVIDNVYGLAPAFVDPDGPDNNPLTYEDNDYRLALGSTQRDSGSNALIPQDTLDLDGDSVTNEPLPFDLNGNPRRVDDPAAPDLGSGTTPLVDQGAFEN